MKVIKYSSIKVETQYIASRKVFKYIKYESIKVEGKLVNWSKACRYAGRK